jgi:y4mF family transcriptional regulator
MDGEVEELARRIRDRRRSLELTQDALADLAGCSQRFVRAVESGKPGVRLEKFLDVVRVLGLAVELVPRKGGG